ncbi:PAS domain S-box protein [uncultured Methanospirillum sp.]|uniref:PAS domain S-box protein n=1 Tax=uncultured Methanospirillum sp. TaxID=262503 RepID=UPI0029C9B149|nr:PAS domain S-box protein [uncultured Methanospirillum sp.]
MQLIPSYINRSSGLLILAVLFIFITLLLFGFFSIHNQQKIAEEEVHSELTTISEMKAKGISDWFGERRSDAEVAMYNHDLGAYLSPSIGTSSVTNDDLLTWMRIFQTSYKYHALFLLSRSGETIISMPESAGISSHSKNATLDTALHATRPLFVDLFLDPDSGEKVLEFWVPIRKQAGDQAVGLLVLQIDPQDYLYPLIQSWPTSSDTAEALIARQENDSVALLSDLKYAMNADLSLKIPTSEDTIPAVMAVKGYRGIFEGNDYRGVPVVASLTNISGTPWYLVAKMDKEEAYASFWNFTYLVIGTIILLVVVGALIILVIWRSRKNEYLQQEITQKDHELFLSDRIRLLMQEANDAILILDEGWRILEVNDRAVDWYGYTREEFGKMVLFDLLTDDAKKHVAEDLAQIGDNDGILFVTKNKKKDSTVFPVEDSVRMITFQGTLYRQAIIHDMSDRIAYETELQEKNATLSSMNEEIGTSYEELASQQEELRFQMETIRRSEQELHEVHSRLTEAQKAGHVGVWEYDLQTDTIWGTDECFTIYGLDHTPDGTKEIYEILPYIQDPDLVTSAIGEVIEKNIPFDVELTIHPADGSSDRIVLSIGELYRDEKGNALKISGIVQDVTEKRRLESDIRRYLEKLSALFNAPVIGTLNGDIYGSIFQVNDEFLRIIGYCREDFETGGIRWTDITPPEFLPLDEKGVSEAREKGSCTPYEKQYLRKDGTRIWVLVGFILLEPDRTESVAFILDISLQKENEKKIRSINQTLEERVTERTNQLSLINEELQTEVEERMAAEQNLQKILSVLSATIESTPEGIFVVGDKGSISVYNKRFVEMWQIPDSVIRAGDERAVLEIMARQVSDPELFQVRMDALSSDPDKDTVDTLLLSDGRIIEQYSKPQRIGYGIVGRVFSFQDITQKKEMEQRIERSLREKEILLKEIHHRVKNNMQVVSSLLFMQSRLSSDPQLKEILLESQNRVKSIALVHEELYQSMDLDRIDYSRYLKKISRIIFDTYKVDPYRISLRLSEKSEFITISKAVPCSLIINELISNSLKHAFPDNRKGTIFIDFTLQDGMYHLLYGDDGVGMAESTLSQTPKTLGLELIRGLVRQLSGSVQIDRNRGITYEIIFPE